MMLDALLASYSDWGLLALRLGLAAVFIAHGWLKLNPSGPLKGPVGFAGWLKTMGVPLPLFFGWLIALLETAGAVMLALGLFARVLALGFVLDMAVAISLVRIRFGKAPFLSGQTSGWELEFILMTASLALLFTGAGRLSLDALLGL